MLLTAVVGIRANTEGSCVCNGEAGAAVGGIHYREQGTGRQEMVSPVTLPITGAPASILTLKLTPDKTHGQNLRQFPVTPGKPFTLDAPIMATANAESAGYVMIVFLDSAGKGVARYNLWFTPSRQRLDSVITDAEGRFRLQPAEAVMNADPEIRAGIRAGQTCGRPCASSGRCNRGEGQHTMPALGKIYTRPTHRMEKDRPWSILIPSMISSSSSTMKLPGLPVKKHGAAPPAICRSLLSAHNSLRLYPILSCRIL